MEILMKWGHPSASRMAILASCSDIVYLARSQRTDMYETPNLAWNRGDRKAQLIDCRHASSRREMM